MNKPVHLAEDVNQTHVIHVCEVGTVKRLTGDGSSIKGLPPEIYVDADLNCYTFDGDKVTCERCKELSYL